MDALGLLALGNSSGGDHGSLLFSFNPAKTYPSLSKTDFVEIDRFNTNVAISGATLCYQLKSNDWLANFMQFDSTSTEFITRIQTIPQASRHNMSSAIDVSADQRIHFAYDNNEIVMYGYSTNGTGATIISTFLAIVSY